MKNMIRAEDTQHSALRTLSARLLSCALVILSLTGVRGQSNSEYKFRQQSITDDASHGNNTDPVPVLTMPCLAANGFAQWTLSAQAGVGAGGAITYPAGWYLMANGLYTPS